ncbi:hypothetical protein BJY52DRAFT_1385866 [Lactarius psammicola]|nr:hypothetical protein BJY52DRAFT_1385866 [Lactarius psammicola]
MSQVSLSPTTNPLVDSSPSNDTQASSADSGAISGTVDQRTGESSPSPRHPRRASDDLPGFSYDPEGHSRDPLDSWPERVEVRSRRRSTLLSSLVRGNQPRRSFFGDNASRHDDSEPAALSENNNKVINPLADNARRLSKTAVSTLKEKVLLPAVPWKQKRSTSQSENSRASVDHRRKFVSPARKSIPHVWRAVSSCRDATVCGSGQLLIQASFAFIPGIIIVSFNDGETRTTERHFVRSSGRIALSALNSVHDVYRDVFDDRITVQDGISHARPYPPSTALVPSHYALWSRFLLGSQAAAKSSVYANVYDSLSSAGVVLILPGFTILISALELTSRNILCGSVRLIYAIIYTFFLGFGLTIGSDISILFVNHKHYDSRRHQEWSSGRRHAGTFTAHKRRIPRPSLVSQGLLDLSMPRIATSLEVGLTQHFDTTLILARRMLPRPGLAMVPPAVPLVDDVLPGAPVLDLLLSLKSAASTWFLADKGALAPAAGALVIGLLGNIYSRWSRGTAFTSMVTGVLFLVPSGLAQAGGLTGNYDSSVQQYYSSFTLGLRMIQVAIGVTIGLFVSQSLIYAFSATSSAAEMAF